MDQTISLFCESYTTLLDCLCLICRWRIIICNYQPFLALADSSPPSFSPPAPLFGTGWTSRSLEYVSTSDVCPLAIGVSEVSVVLRDVPGRGISAVLQAADLVAACVEMEIHNTHPIVTDVSEIVEESTWSTYPMFVCCWAKGGLSGSCV